MLVAAGGRRHPIEQVFRIMDATTREPAPNPMALAIRHNKTMGLTANCVLIGRHGGEVAIEDSAAPIHDRRGQVTGAVMVFRDVSTTRAMSLKMSHLAQHDSLTDLPNRVLLNDRLTQAITLAHRNRKNLALLFLDVDRFKKINDSLGHNIGDHLLQTVAQRLLACVRITDTVSRQGGDEFVVLLSDVAHTQDAAVSADKILVALSALYTVDQHELYITVSIGIVTYCRQARAWQDAGLPPLRIAINVSAVELRARTSFKGASDPERDGLGAGISRARADGNVPDAGLDVHVGSSSGPQGNGCAARTRRLRHWLLELELSEALSDQYGEDRSVIRARSHHRC